MRTRNFSWWWTGGRRHSSSLVFWYQRSETFYGSIQAFGNSKVRCSVIDSGGDGKGSGDFFSVMSFHFIIVKIRMKR